MKLPSFDPYHVLGVPADATVEQIKTAHRHLVRKHHPDRNSDPAAPARFMQVQEAYDLLSDPARRNEYKLHIEKQRREREARAERERHEQIAREQAERLRAERESAERLARARAERLGREIAERRQTRASAGENPSPSSWTSTEIVAMLLFLVGVGVSAYFGIRVGLSGRWMGGVFVGVVGSIFSVPLAICLAMAFQPKVWEEALGRTAGAVSAFIIFCLGATAYIVTPVILLVTFLRVEESNITAFLLCASLAAPAIVLLPVLLQVKRLIATLHGDILCCTTSGAWIVARYSMIIGAEAFVVIGVWLAGPELDRLQPMSAGELTVLFNGLSACFGLPLIGITLARMVFLLTRHEPNEPEHREIPAGSSDPAASGVWTVADVVRCGEFETDLHGPFKRERRINVDSMRTI